MDSPSPARMYDYFLGGSFNFLVDREAAGRVQELYPDTPYIMRANRAFLRRAVRFLGAQGIDQFLDIGSGLPTVGNVHDVARRDNPAVHVVYVDSDPVAVHHSLDVLREMPSTGAIRADARDPAYILQHPEVRRLLDFSRPVAVLLVAVLHFIESDAQIYNLLRTLRASMASGSYLVISHSTLDGVAQESAAQTERLYADTVHPFKTRTRAQVAPFFAGLNLVEPGLVYAPLWHPEGPEDLFVDQPARSTLLVGVGQKP